MCSIRETRKHRKFIRNLQQSEAQTQRMIQRAMQRVSQRVAADTPHDEIMLETSKEYARLMCVPSDLFDAYVATVLSNFYAELVRTSPDDPLLDTDAGQQALEAKDA